MTFQTTTQSLRASLTSAAAALLLTAGAVHAQTIHWGNNIFDDLVQSDGTPITAADGFHFELGIFSGGFTPTSGNPGDWMTNWRPLDAAVFNEAARYFSSSFNIIPDSGDPQQGYSDSPEAQAGLRVQEGQQLWVLVYNNTSMDTGTELFLAGAGTWTLPAVTGSQTAMPTNYRLTQARSTPVFGGVNDNRGGGNYSDNPPSYTLQTATFVPEPGSLALALAAAGLLARRRRGN